MTASSVIIKHTYILYIYIGQVSIRIIVIIVAVAVFLAVGLELLHDLLKGPFQTCLVIQ